MKTQWRYDKSRIYTWRHRAGLSPEQFGNKIGVSDQTIRNWEKGRTAPSCEMAAHIANVFGCTPLEFFALAPHHPRLVPRVRLAGPIDSEE